MALRKRTSHDAFSADEKATWKECDHAKMKLLVSREQSGQFDRTASSACRSSRNDGVLLWRLTFPEIQLRSPTQKLRSNEFSGWYQHEQITP